MSQILLIKNVASHLKTPRYTVSALEPVAHCQLGLTDGQLFIIVCPVYLYTGHI